MLLRRRLTPGGRQPVRPAAFGPVRARGRPDAERAELVEGGTCGPAARLTAYSIRANLASNAGSGVLLPGLRALEGEPPLGQ
jgi:hypothetical protein